MENLFMILILVGIVGIFYFWKKDKKKRNISIGVAIVSFVLFGITSPDVEEGYEKGVESATEEVEKEEDVEEESEQAEEETEEISRESEIKEVITKRANEHSLYKKFDVENIRVNEDLGDENSDKLIVLVDLIWTAKNKEETADEFIEDVSNDIAANLHNEGADDISEIAIFTKDEYNSKQTKYSFENQGKGFKLMDHSTSI